MEKEVKIKLGSNFLIDVLDLVKKGLNPAQICIHLNITPQRLNYYISSLKKQNVIKKKGYGVWEVNPVEELKMNSHKGSLRTKNIRGHAYIWRVKTDKVFNWNELLENSEVYSEPKGIKDTPRIIINNRKVWLGKNFITVFEPKDESYFGLTAMESDKEAVFQLVNTIELIKKALNIDFKYKFTCSRHHYGHIDSIEAKRVIKNGKTILIKNEKGFWFSIDYSQNKYKEAEMIGEVGQNEADIQSLQYQNYMNSHERTNFKVTPEFILDGFDKLIKKSETDMQLINKFGNELTRHIPAYEKLGKEVERINDVLSELSSVIKELRK